MSSIHRTMWIEELADILPESVRYLIDRGMKPFACGEPVWETVESMARSKGFSESEIDRLVEDLNKLSGSATAETSTNGIS